MAECVCGLVWHSDSILTSRETFAACALIRKEPEVGSLVAWGYNEPVQVCVKAYPIGNG